MAEETRYRTSVEGREHVSEISMGKPIPGADTRTFELLLLAMPTKGLTYEELKRRFHKVSPKVPVSDEELRKSIRRAFEEGYLEVAED